MLAQSLHHIWLFVTPWTVVRQAPLSMGFPRHEYWSWVAISFSSRSSQSREDPYICVCVCVCVCKITADGDCSHEIKRRLLLGRKVMTNLDSIFKSRDITLPTKVHLVRLWFFQWSCMDVRAGLWRKLSAEELMLLNCSVGEDSWESLGLQGDPTSPFWSRSGLGDLWEEWC